MLYLAFHTQRKSSLLFFVVVVVVLNQKCSRVLPPFVLSSPTKGRKLWRQFLFSLHQRRAENCVRFMIYTRFYWDGNFCSLFTNEGPKIVFALWFIRDFTGIVIFVLSSPMKGRKLFALWSILAFTGTAIFFLSSPMKGRKLCLLYDLYWLLLGRQFLFSLHQWRAENCVRFMIYTCFYWDGHF